VNGIELVKQGPKLPIATLALRLPAGSQFERLKRDKDDSGVSLLYKHALFGVLYDLALSNMKYW
jgi:hypothetical protein